MLIIFGLAGVLPNENSCGSAVAVDGDEQLSMSSKKNIIGASYKINNNKNRLKY